jgi:predicted ribosomally synthesized peptide with SipW-like signal peptide
MIKARKKQIIIALALVTIMGIAGTSAYFTASDEAVNTWTVGKVEIDLEETEYDKYKEKETKDITPNAELHKDPKAINTGNNDAFVFMRVRMPKATVKVAGPDGAAPEAATLQELFEYQWNTGWTVINTQEITENNSVYQEYVLAYDTADECTALAPESETPVLFINGDGAHIANPGAVGLITFKNVIEGQGLENVKLELDVESYAIQTSNLTTEDTKSPLAVWDILMTQSGV